tara:strand:- start:1192 stop:1749 length:558 start_codon:yes stop_codon:yes gene_type:complete
MLILVAGLILFLGVHSLQVIPGLRPRLRAGLGEAPYKLIYTALSLIGLGLLIYGKIIAHPPLVIWSPPEWGRHLAFLIVQLSLILLVAAYAPGHIRRIVRHPMLAAVALWSGAHFLANGELSAMLLFGGFFIWSVITYVSACLRETPPPVVRGWGGDLTAIVLGVLLSLIIINVHMYLFGVAIIG